MKNNSEILKELVLFKERFDSVIDECIEKTKNDEAIDKIEELPIGALKYIFENVSKNLCEDKKGKKILKEYVTNIKSDKSLKNFFTLFETIKAVNGVNDTKTFVNEALTIKRGQNKNSVKKIGKIVKEAFEYSDLNYNDLNRILEDYNKSIDFPLSYILSENKNNKNLVEYTNNLNEVNNYLGDRSEIIKENKFNKEETINNLNKLISETSNEGEKQLLKDISLCIMSGKDKSELFEEYKNNCLSIIDECLNNSDDINSKNNFQTMKDKLYEKEYKEERFINDIVKLYEFKETLENE